MLPKQGKALEDPASHKPTSLLLVFSKLFEKLFYERIRAITDELMIITKHQFGFCSKQTCHIAETIRNAFEIKEFCSALFLDVKQVFDRM